MMHVTLQAPTLYEAASVKFIPIIDLNSSDETCIFFTLLFVIEPAKKLNIPTPCLTFDQPLWQKAMRIIKDKNLKMVCRLGGFHTLMSFLGSIGNLMSGAGLEDVFEEVYSEDTVKHIKPGHSFHCDLSCVQGPRRIKTPTNAKIAFSLLFVGFTCEKIPSM